MSAMAGSRNTATIAGTSSAQMSPSSGLLRRPPAPREPATDLSSAAGAAARARRRARSDPSANPSRLGPGVRRRATASAPPNLPSRPSAAHVSAIRDAAGDRSLCARAWRAARGAAAACGRRTLRQGGLPPKQSNWAPALKGRLITGAGKSCQSALPHCCLRAAAGASQDLHRSGRSRKSYHAALSTKLSELLEQGTKQSAL